jgi:broad specificity phosphatase PhoE
VTEVVRLTLISHAMTDAMAAGRFPADEPLNDIGRRQAEAVTGLQVPGRTRQLTGPERRARQTAQLLRLDAVPDPRLADLDCASWRGQTLAEVRQDDLAEWLTDPARSPHGGETIVDLIGRVATWLASLTEDAKSATVAVTHPAVIRAAVLLALGAPPKSFWRIDVVPTGRTVMHFRGECWTLRL